MSNKPAPRCQGCGKEMELMGLERNTWRYSCEDCGWRSPAVHGPVKEGNNVAYAKAMQRYAVNPWISVNDRMPEPEQKYVARCFNGIITHWMPIPPLPNEGE